MGQNDLFERLYGLTQSDPEEEVVKPHLKSRSGRSFLESLRNEEIGDSCQPDASHRQD